jgi:putative transposase
MNRPDLRDLFRAEVLRDKRKRNKRMAKAVMEHGYTQREVADHLKMHFTSVSRILRTEEKMPTK